MYARSGITINALKKDAHVALKKAEEEPVLILDNDGRGKAFLVSMEDFEYIVSLVKERNKEKEL